MRPAEAGNLPAHPHKAESVLHRPFQGGGQLGDGEFGRVDQIFGGGHGDSANKTGPPKLEIFTCQRQSVSGFSFLSSRLSACLLMYSVLQSSPSCKILEGSHADLAALVPLE